MENVYVLKVFLLFFTEIHITYIENTRGGIVITGPYITLSRPALSATQHTHKTQNAQDANIIQGIQGSAFSFEMHCSHYCEWMNVLFSVFFFSKVAFVGRMVFVRPWLLSGPASKEEKDDLQCCCCRLLGEYKIVVGVIPQPWLSRRVLPVLAASPNPK